VTSSPDTEPEGAATGGATSAGGGGSEGVIPPACRGEPYDCSRERTVTIDSSCIPPDLTELTSRQCNALCAPTAPGAYAEGSSICRVSARDAATVSVWCWHTCSP
jgi:hypothetical protein